MIKGFRIIEFDHIRGLVEDYHAHGAFPGLDVGYENLSGLYTMKMGSVTDWTGFPQSGKTQLLMNVLHNTSIKFGLKHLLYVPDVGELMEILDVLIHIHTGKTFKKQYNNHISLKEAFSSLNFLLEHFKILDPVDETPLTPSDFWTFAAEYDCHTATIDSWKDLLHEYEKFGNSYARYLSYMLPLRNRIAQKSNKHFHTVIHPKSPRRTKDGLIVPPEPDDLEGGAQWNNSGKTIVCCNRPAADSTHMDFYVLKAKPRIVGRRGQTVLWFDVETCRYFQRDEYGNKFYAYQKATEKNENHF